MKVGVVSAYVPLKVKHLTATQYHTLWEPVHRAVIEAGGTPAAWMVPDVKNLWLSQENPPMVPANPVPSDRYDTPEENVLSNIVQHNRTQWALDAAAYYKDIDVWVWLDYGVRKQGDFRNNRVTADAIAEFIWRVGTTPKEVFDTTIPFPGITEKQTVYPTGNVWRFCGSTHIWPTKFLPDIDRAYKETLRRWIVANRTTPLDLPIWALVEQKYPELPFQWYGAEYDASQFTNYPYGEPR